MTSPRNRVLPDIHGHNPLENTAKQGTYSTLPGRAKAFEPAMIGLEGDVLPLNERRTEAASERRTSMTEASLEQNMTAARDQHLVPGREIHLQDMRGYRFCEVGLITGTSQDNAIANIWNTTGVCDPTPEQFDTLDAETIAREQRSRARLAQPGKALDVRPARCPRSRRRQEIRVPSQAPGWAW